LVEGVDLAGDPGAVPALGEGRHAPVGDGEDEDAGGVAAGEGDGAGEEGAERRAVRLRVAPAVLVVDADEEGDEVVASGHAALGPAGGICDLGRVEAGSQLVGRPAGDGDGGGVLERDALRAQPRGELVRPAVLGRDALADGVGVAEGEVAEGRAHAAVTRSRSRSASSGLLSGPITSRSPPAPRRTTRLVPVPKPAPSSLA